MSTKTIYLTIFAVALVASLAHFLWVDAATVLFPYQGGTGTSTTPGAGQLLIGKQNGDGTYVFIASSTLSSGGTSNLGTVATSGTPLANNIAFWTNPSLISGTSSFRFATSTNLFEVFGISSSTNLLSPSSTIGTIVFNSATSSTNLALSYSTASRCLRLDGSKNIVAASGDCTSGDTDTDTFASAGVDGQFLFGKLGGGATSSQSFTVNTSTLTFTFGTGSLLNAQSVSSTYLYVANDLFVVGHTDLAAGTSTNWQATRLTVTGQTQLSNTSSSGNVTIVGTLNVASSSLLGGQISGGTCSPTPAASIVIDLDACRAAQWIAAQNVTTTFANGRNGGRYSITIVQDGTGSRLAGWSSSTTKFSNGVIKNGTSTGSCWSSWMIEYASSTYYFKGYAEGC